MRDIWERYHQFIGFLVSITVCFSINLLAMKCTGDSYREGQKRIIDSYENSISVFDSLQKKNEDALNRVLHEREQTITKILSDTFIERTQGLCSQQKEAIKKYVRPYLEVTTRELDIKEKIKSDPNHEIQLLRDEIKSLLQLEFNKMQNEYESLELWAAILTVVFLIFSFYSFFKTEHLEEQGHQSITRIGDMEVNTRQELQDLRDDIRRENNEQSGRFASAFNDMIQSQRTRFQDNERNMAETFQSYQARFEELLNEVQNHECGAFDDEDETVVNEDVIETDSKEENT